MRSDILIRLRKFETKTLSKFGHNHYAGGWEVAGDTPFTWTKQVAGSYGGTRNGMVVYWPKGANER